MGRRRAVEDDVPPPKRGHNAKKRPLNVGNKDRRHRGRTCFVMTDENAAYDVVEARLDGELIAEAPLPSDDDSAGAGSTAVHEPILGATPAETPPVESAPDEETPAEKYARLRAEGYKPSQIVVLTGTGGTPVEVRLA